MKIHVEIDATPEEIRAFFGLPDVAPFQEELMSKLYENMKQGMEGYDPANLAKLVFPPAGLSAMEKYQKMFWEFFEAAQSKQTKKDSK
ncbi:MAG: DUF6489 family protein [Gammaproteobacteria bacterium]|nr:DUF6489 family protein [Gammaproteobacteria bacterium]